MSTDALEMRANPLAFLADDLRALRARGAWRRPRVLEGSQEAVSRYDGHEGRSQAPIVPAARIRAIVTAAHTREQLAAALDAFARAGPAGSDLT
jgi:hypothetical protein